MVLRALVFDFDGLIVETEEPEFVAWQSIWTDHGLDLTLAEWAECIGTHSAAETFDPFGELVRRSGRTDLDEAAVRAEKRSRSLPLLEATGMQPGVADLIEAAIAVGVRMAIASSSPRHWIDRHLDRLGLADSFATISCFDDVGVTKPDPASYRHALGSLQIDEPLDAVALEDSPPGVASAKAAGLRCIAVPTPMTQHLDFSAADAVVTSLAGLSPSDVDHLTRRRRPAREAGA